MVRVAAIDIGTVSVRLAVADVESGRVGRCARQSRICDLGEGVAETGMLSGPARSRVTSCVDEYLSLARAAGAEAVCCTLTSAARDASNSAALLGELGERGLAAQVIPGTVEGTLTFLGVAQDFLRERILVADNGGGSTELACGTLSERLDIEWVTSVDVGCRRVTERFLSREDPPGRASLGEAHAFCAGSFAPVIPWRDATEARPGRLVVVGGTVTSLVAIDAALDPYDSSRVHLHDLTLDQVLGIEKTMSELTLEERGHLVGLQAKRAPVILGGAVAVSELMRQAGFDRLTVSESDLLFGLSLAAASALEGTAPLVAWKPELMRLS